MKVEFDKNGSFSKKESKVSLPRGKRIENYQKQMAASDSSSPLRGEGRERVIKSMAKGLTHLARNLRIRSIEAIRERLQTPSPQSPPLKGGEQEMGDPLLKGGKVNTHTK